MPSARAGSTSGTIDIPTTVGAQPRSIATSVGVSYAGPRIAAVHALGTATPNAPPRSTASSPAVPGRTTA